MCFQFVAEIGGMMAFFLGISLISLIGKILFVSLLILNLFLFVAILSRSLVRFSNSRLIAECCCYGAVVCRRRFKCCGSRAEVGAEKDQQAAEERGRKKKVEGRGGGGEEEEEEKDRSRWRQQHQREMAARAARLERNA